MTERVRVTAPRSGRPRRTTGAAEIDAQSELGEVFMQSLLRTQLRLALRTVLLLAVLVGSWPLLFAVFPAVGRAHVLGVRLAWLLPGVLAYPVLVALGWLHTRAAERHERAFRELLERR